MSNIQLLEKLNTRHLLGLLQKTRMPECMGIPHHHGTTVYFPNPSDQTNYVILTADEIREVLKEREHVPNKEEARKIRQERAKK